MPLLQISYISTLKCCPRSKQPHIPPSCGCSSLTLTLSITFPTAQSSRHILANPSDGAQHSVPKPPPCAVTTELTSVTASPYMSDTSYWKCCASALTQHGELSGRRKLCVSIFTSIHSFCSGTSIHLRNVNTAIDTTVIHSLYHQFSCVSRQYCAAIQCQACKQLCSQLSDTTLSIANTKKVLKSVIWWKGR